jgi:hypothetical protein
MYGSYAEGGSFLSNPREARKDVGQTKAHAFGSVTYNMFITPFRKLYYS